MDVFNDPKKSAYLALGLGFLGGPLVAIGIAAESVVVLVIGIILLAASGIAWAIRGVKEDELSEQS